MKESVIIHERVYKYKVNANAKYENTVKSCVRDRLNSCPVPSS